MRLNEVKDVTVRSSDASRLRQSIVQYFYGKTNDVKTKTAIFCKRHPHLIHQLASIAIKVVDASGNFSGNKIYTGNNEKALVDKLSTIGSASQVPSMNEYFSDAISDENAVEVAYPNFVWQDEYLPIRVRVDNSLLINYYNALYSYFDNWYKLNDEFRELKSSVNIDSSGEKKIDEENVDNPKANDETDSVAERLTSNRSGNLLLEADESNDNILLYYRNIINDRKEKKITDQVFLEAFNKFQEDYSRAVGNMAVKKFGSSRQLGVFFPGNSNDFDFRIEFGNPINARNLLTFVFKLPIREPESWLEKMVNYYSNFATTYSASRESGKEVVGVDKDGNVKTEEVKATLTKDDIKQLKLSNDNTLDYVVVSQDVTKLVLDNKSYALGNYREIDREVFNNVSDNALSDNEKAYKVIKSRKGRLVVESYEDTFVDLDKKDDKDFETVEAKVCADLVKSISKERGSSSLGEILDLIQNNDKSIINLGLDTSSDRENLIGIRQAYLSNAPKNKKDLFNALLKHAYGSNSKDIYLASTGKIRTLTNKIRSSEKYKNSEEVVKKSNLNDIINVDSDLKECFRYYNGSGVVHITLLENNKPAYFVKFTTPLSKIRSLSEEYLVKRSKNLQQTDDSANNDSEQQVGTSANNNLEQQVDNATNNNSEQTDLN